MRIAPLFISAMRSFPKNPLLDGRPSTWIETMSDAARSWLRLRTRAALPIAKRSATSWKITCMPSASARTDSCVPIDP